uniref:Ubiquinone biosynthesis protein n=1 Tax=Rhizophora mucronata TaxID=61149 RepID=A0A2P2KVL0_RHIMU
MYRTATRRLLAGANVGNSSNACLRFLSPRSVISGGSRLCNSTSHQSIPDHSQIQSANAETTSSSASSSQSNSTTSAPGWSTSSNAEDSSRKQRQGPRAEYQDEQARVLQASLRHVLRLGWSEEAMIAGARDVGVSPSIVGSFPRKEAALVEFFMDECLQKLIDRIGSGEELQKLVPSERISKLVRIRLEMQAPHVSKWPQALSIQAHPSNAPTSFKQRAMLVDEIWHAVDDDGSDIDWYVKRTVLGGIYSTTEIYMLTDSSPDSFDLKKTIQEAKYLAEAVGAGMGNSLQGFLRRVFQGGS